MDDCWLMIDFGKFPNEAISGLTLEQINNIMKEDRMLESGEVEDYIDVGLFLNDNTLMPDLDIIEDIVCTLNETEHRMKPTSSAKQEKQHTEKFNAFLTEKNIQCDWKTIAEERLNN